jgi:hypothetical protein
MNQKIRFRIGQAERNRWAACLRGIKSTVKILQKSKLSLALRRSWKTRRMLEAELKNHVFVFNTCLNFAKYLLTAIVTGKEHNRAKEIFEEPSAISFCHRNCATSEREGSWKVQKKLSADISCKLKKPCRISPAGLSNATTGETNPCVKLHCFMWSAGLFFQHVVCSKVLISISESFLFLLVLVIYIVSFTQSFRSGLPTLCLSLWETYWRTNFFSHTESNFIKTHQILQANACSTLTTTIILLPVLVLMWRR